MYLICKEKFQKKVRNLNNQLKNKSKNKSNNNNHHRNYNKEIIMFNQIFEIIHIILLRKLI